MKADDPCPQLIRAEIERHGPITFARFMELALYAPGAGYYEGRRKIGREGDFFTSVRAGPLFGELLAFQFAEWLETDCAVDKSLLVEAGPHDAMLAADILPWLRRRRPGLLARLEYVLIESSAARRQWQEQTLRDWRTQVRWVADVAELGVRQVIGIIFSNEFLDALPVHRLSWCAQERNWQEWRVTVESDTFAWRRGALTPDLAARAPRLPAELAAVLPDGFVLELSLAAADWWRTAAASLRHGKLLTIDYGLTRDERFRPERTDGTLRAFARHHGGADLLAQPGQQDLTAHVDFSALEEAGAAAGLRTEAFVSQSKFLTEIVARTQGKPESFDPWDEKRVRQFQTLAHPEHLGRFRVLVQS